MACFCKDSFAALTLALPSLDVGAAASLPGAGLVASLAAKLSGSVGMPDWSPDLAWLELELPSVRMSAQATATISALAQMRAQALALFELDLLASADVAAFASLAASLDARMAVSVDAAAWLELAGLEAAMATVSLALEAGLLAPSASLVAALSLQAPQWGGLTVSMQAIAPLLAACLQLDVPVTATADLAAAIRVLARLPLPALGSLGAMANLTAALSAVASLKLALGVDPIAVGLPSIRATLEARLGALLADLSALSIDVSLGLPSLPSLPSLLITAPTVSLAMQAGALAALDWNVPAVVASVSVGLPVCALGGGLQAALGISASLGAGCAACAFA